MKNKRKRKIAIAHTFKEHIKTAIYYYAVNNYKV